MSLIIEIGLDSQSYLLIFFVWKENTPITMLKRIGTLATHKPLNEIQFVSFWFANFIECVISIWKCQTNDHLKIIALEL